MTLKRIAVMLVLAGVLLACGLATPTATEPPTDDLATSVALTLTAAAPSETPPPQTGSIQGQLSYPSEFVPPMIVVAYQAGDYNSYYYVYTVENQPTYQIDNLPPGVYHVVSYPSVDLGQPPDLGGGYSQSVPCGLQYGCNDHSLIDVVVTAGQVTTGIDPGDWYAPPGAFPPRPNP